MKRQKFIKLMMAEGFPKNFVNSAMDVMLKEIKAKGMPKGAQLSYEYQAVDFSRRYHYLRQNSAKLKTYSGKKPWKNTLRDRIEAELE